VLSMSPDIILRQSSVGNNPQGTFGQGSHTEDNDYLSQDVQAGKDSAIYVRLRNRGGSNATNVSVNVYYSRPATLQTPNLWTPIGTVTLPSIPTANILTVSPELVWPAAAIPGPGHYCFIAVAGNADDPAPALADFKTFDNYTKFIENNNKVAWRNFNILSGPPSREQGIPHHLPILIPGAFDIARVFTLETLGSLPRDSTVKLEVPLTLARQLRFKVPESQIQGKIVVLPLSPFAQSILGTGVLPPGSLAKCSLLISVPEKTYTKPGVYDFAIRQLSHGREVGRVTWHFGQPASLKPCHCREDRGCQVLHRDTYH
jgi:serine protease